MLVIAIDLVYLRFCGQSSLVIETVEDASGERAISKDLYTNYYQQTIADGGNISGAVGEMKRKRDLH